MTTISLDVHHVTQISAETKLIGEGPSAFYVTKLRLRAEDGSETLVTAFTGDEVLAIEGSDHVNHLASDEEVMEVAL